MIEPSPFRTTQPVSREVRDGATKIAQENLERDRQQKEKQPVREPIRKQSKLP